LRRCMSAERPETSGVRRFRFRFKETIATVLVERDETFKRVVELMLYAREKIEEKIHSDPFFLVTYYPYDCSEEIVERMCRASKLAGVGPMAAVAGTIAGYAVENVEEPFVVVDNGGDIALRTDRKILVGIYPTNLAFEIEPTEFLAICTSSGKIGHSVSFGYADAATVVAKDASVADAFATALGNTIEKGDGKKEIEEKLEEFWRRAKDYVEGVLVVKDDILAFAGDVPELRKAKINPDVITKG